MRISAFDLEKKIRINPLKTTVTRACQLLGTFSFDCHKYVQTFVAHRRDTSFSAIRLNYKKCAGPEPPRTLGNVGQTEPHVFPAAVLKVLNLNRVLYTKKETD
ncbi:hypothetical protein AVEN_77335-1 [Araneus ventricosus]|uniref:Uncharacterized protein n=1 Tax=Araneus ventricosus TaxID=182803 RepID=A0A4Y2C853_ARAVE|nr:hypothetical protein AVEN_77335-1 [Araneus ventricosus]